MEVVGGSIPLATTIFSRPRYLSAISRIMALVSTCFAVQ